MRKIIGIGETVLDIIFKNDTPSAAVPGGSTFNAMISLGRTARRDFPGTPVLMVTEVGDDHIGDIITSFMTTNGVSDESVTRNTGTQSHISLAFLNENNDASYEFYKDHAAASLSEDKVGLVKFEKGDLVLFGSFFAINPKIRAYTKGLLEAAHKAGSVLYYDINFRFSHIKDIPDTIENIRENCRLSDFVRGSLEDFKYLFGIDDPQQVYENEICQLCPNFICTCGADPVHVFTPDMHKTYDVKPVETVSTIGAGDNFNAGFLYGLLESDICSSKVDVQIWDKLIATAGQFSAAACQSLNNYVDADFEIK